MLTPHPRGARSARVAGFALAVTSFFVPGSADARDPRGASALSPPTATLVRLEGGKTPTFGVSPAPGKERAPTAIYLHGIQGKPENGCPWFAGGPFGWLVCPAATRALGGGTFSWAWTSDDAAVIASAEGLARSQGAPREPPVVVGFSQGAYVAAHLVAAGGVRYRALVLIGADVVLDARSLNGAGVSRVALAAGDNDAASPGMRRTAKALAAEGVDATFVSLGRAGHTYVPETPERLAALTAALTWAAAAAGAPAS